MDLILSKQTIELLIDSEVSSEAYYNAKLQHPYFPGGNSGITVGVGYDLSQHSPQEITATWGKFVTTSQLNAMLKCIGKIGTTAKNLLNDPILKTIDIPFEQSEQVFYTFTLPRYVKMTQHLYPGLELLEPDAIGSLVSMVFNRGASLIGADRVEMAAIVKPVTQKNYAFIADQIDHSKRLWVEKSGMEGIVLRREKEAIFTRNCVHKYEPTDLIKITI